MAESSIVCPTPQGDQSQPPGGFFIRRVVGWHNEISQTANRIVGGVRIVALQSRKGGFLRPRISLKRLLIAIGALSVVFYLSCVRPTQVAENFVADVKRGDFKELDSLTVGGELFKDRLLLLIPNLPDLKDAEINGGVGPQSWRSVIRFQRVCHLEFAYPPMDQVKPGEYQAFVTVVLTAGITGVKGRAWMYDERWAGG